MSLDNSSEKLNGFKTDVGPAIAEGQESQTNRRRFTRNVLLSSGVFLSLGNRAAWGYTGNHVGECMSNSTLASFMAGDTPNALASYRGDKAEFAQDILDLQNSNNGQIDGQRACPVNSCNEYGDNGGVMIVQGNCPKAAASTTFEVDRTANQIELLYEEENTSGI